MRNVLARHFMNLFFYLLNSKVSPWNPSSLLWKDVSRAWARLKTQIITPWVINNFPSVRVATWAAPGMQLAQPQVGLGADARNKIQNLGKRTMGWASGVCPIKASLYRKGFTSGTAQFPWLWYGWAKLEIKAVSMDLGSGRSQLCIPGSYGHPPWGSGTVSCWIGWPEAKTKPFSHQNTSAPLSLTIYIVPAAGTTP